MFIQTHNQTRSSVAMTDGIVASLEKALGEFLTRLLRWADRSRQRRALAALDDHLLADIGISRSMAATESSKPFWQ